MAGGRAAGKSGAGASASEVGTDDGTARKRKKTKKDGTQSDALDDTTMSSPGLQGNVQTAGDLHSDPQDRQRGGGERNGWTQRHSCGDHGVLIHPSYSPPAHLAPPLSLQPLTL